MAPGFSIQDHCPLEDDMWSVFKCKLCADFSFFMWTTNLWRLQNFPVVKRTDNIMLITLLGCYFTITQAEGKLSLAWWWSIVTNAKIFSCCAVVLGLWIIQSSSFSHADFQCILSQLVIWKGSCTSVFFVLLCGDSEWWVHLFWKFLNLHS